MQKGLQNYLGRNSFTVTTELDAKIANELWSYINEWDGDGRIFRDCTYNYEVIFGLVENQDLYNDYQKIKEYVSY